MVIPVPETEESEVLDCFVFNLIVLAQESKRETSPRTPGGRP